MESSLKCVKVDGSLYEGGGQMFRNSLALSTITAQPVKLEKIRANRPNPGLNRQLQTGISIMTQLSGAQVEGGELKSQVVTYIPKSIRSGNFKGDCQTAGSIALMIQMTMPSLLFGKKASKINLKGGTCVAKSPSLKYFDKVLFPLLQRFGINAGLRVIEEGFYPLGGGEAELTVEPLKGKELQAVNITRPGKINRVYVQVIVKQDDKTTATGYLNEIQEEVKKIMKTQYKEQEVNEIEFTLEYLFSESLMKVELSARTKEIGKKNDQEPCQEGDNPKRILYGLLLFAYGENVYFDCSCVCNKEFQIDKEYIQSAIGTFESYLKSGSCVDEHTQDQLLLFMLLAKGKSELVCTKNITDHTISCFYIFKLFFPGLDYKIEEEQDKGLARIQIEGKREYSITSILLGLGVVV